MTVVFYQTPSLYLKWFTNQRILSFHSNTQTINGFQYSNNDIQYHVNINLINTNNSNFSSSDTRMWKTKQNCSFAIQSSGIWVSLPTPHMYVCIYYNKTKNIHLHSTCSIRLYRDLKIGIVITEINDFSYITDIIYFFFWIR